MPTASEQRNADANRLLVGRFVTEWLNERRRDTLNSICDPAISYHWGILGDGRGVDALAALEEMARAAFPDIAVRPLLTVADGTFVVNHSEVTGTHRGTWFGVAPTGKRATWSATEIYRVHDSRIVEQWLNEDWASVMAQLSSFPS